MKLYVSVVLYVLLQSESHAYLDPGTGSILIQGLIAGIAATALVVKTYWYRIKSFLGKNNVADVNEGMDSKQTEQQDTTR